MGMVSFFLAILVLAVNVNARNIVVLKKMETQDPVSSDGLSPEVLCNYCLEISREVEKVLADPQVPEKASVILVEFCHILPSNLQAKCLEMSNMYIHQVILVLQDTFREEKLCNSTGLCPRNMESFMLSSIWNKMLLSGLEADNQEDSLHTEAQAGIPFKLHLQSLTDKISDNSSCTACHNALNEILDDLENPETKIKVLKVLLKACEEVGNHVKECKKLVFEYGPLILANVEKFLKNNDVCSIVHACNNKHQTGRTADI